MRLVLGTKHYNYLVRLGLPLPPQEAIDDYISKMETEIEEDNDSTTEGKHLIKQYI